jgi:hypothetical protein
MCTLILYNLFDGIFFLFLLVDHQIGDLGLRLVGKVLVQLLLMSKQRRSNSQSCPTTS